MESENKSFEVNEEFSKKGDSKYLKLKNFHISISIDLETTFEFE